MFFFNNKEIKVKPQQNFLEIFNENNQLSLNISKNLDKINFKNKDYFLYHTTQNYKLNNNEYKFIDCDMYDDLLPIKYAIGKINNQLYLYYLKIIF